VIAVEIRETLFTKSMVVETDDPYIVAMDFMKRVSDNHAVYERQNAFATDGPVKKATLVFDVVEALDAFSQIEVNFSMEGENNSLYINVKAEFVVRIKEKGLFSEVFTEFYLKNVYPSLQKASARTMQEIEKEIGSI